MGSTIVSTTQPNRQRLHSMSEDYRGTPGLEYHSLAAHFGQSVHDESLPMLINLPHLFLCEEGSPTARDLEARRDFRRYFENYTNQALQEFSWVHGEKQRLMEHLEDLQSQLSDLSELRCLDIDELFAAEHIGYDEAARRTLTTRPGTCNLDQNKRFAARRQLDEELSSRAKSQLDLYNKQWKETQAQAAEGAASPSTQASLPIPWPKASSIRTRQFQRELVGTTAAPETLAWKWATHAFFVEAFGLRPVFNRDEKNEATFGLASDHGRTKTLAKLKALRRQMKVEKVRWHEDKMKAAFGLAAATHEKVKAVWGVVINLRDIVERELESSLT